jgi:hypothetical protein
VLAQEDENAAGNGLRITPVRQELTLGPGQNDSYTIEVTNVTTAPTTVTAIVNDFESDNESGQPRLIVNTDRQSPFSIKPFLDLPGNFTLEPGESRLVTMSVRIPDEAMPGGYFGAIRFEAGAASPADDGTAVALSASVASLLLVSVPGEADETMSLEFIEARQDGQAGRFLETAPDTVAIKLNNEGNTILKPIGRVSVKNMFDNEVYSYELNGGQVRGNVLPQSSRVFEDAVENIGFIGRYTVEANLSYGEGGGNIITASTTFWVIPWKILLIGATILAFLIWFGTKGLKAYNRRVVARARRG